MVDRSEDRARATWKNAVITKVRISFERGATYWIDLDYGGACQSAGGILFGKHDGHFLQHLEHLCIVFEVLGWNQLVGKACRVLSSNTFVHEIQHFLKDTSFAIEHDVK